MYTIWSFFIKNNRFSYLLMLALFGFGLFALLSIPRESSPEVQVPVGIVTTVLPGAPASDVESLVTNEIERGLTGALENVKEITSSSREGISSVTVEFEASADIDESILDLKDQVDTIIPDLPDDAEDPLVTEVNFVDQPILTLAVAGELNPSAFTVLADDLEGEIEKIPGVSRVETSGVRSREVSVVVNQESLAAFDLSISDVVTGLRAANLTFPVGQIENAGVSYNLAFEGDIAETNEIPDVAIASRNGQPVFVRDIATIEDSLAPAASLSRLSLDNNPSQNSISLDVYKQRGGDITQLTDAINARVAELQAEGQFLFGLDVLAVLDSGQDIEDDLIQLSTSGFQTVILVVLVLIVAIGWREGLLAGTAIPMSFLLGFIGLYLSGNTINFLSLFALILGIGVLVDSGIVMVEGINRRMKEDETIDKREAALLTIRDFATPLVSGTLTTVSMFVGLFIVSGVTGQFIASIPFTLVFILFASLLVALGFLPLLASGVLKRRSATTFEKKQVAYAKQLEDWYRGKLALIIGHKSRERTFLWCIRGLLLLALLLPVFGVVKVVFFEQSDVEFVIVEIELPEGSQKEDTDIAVRRVEEELYKTEYIESFLTTVGSGSAFGGGGSGEKFGNIFITLNEDRALSSTEITTDLRKRVDHIRDVSVTVSQPNTGPPTGAPIGFTFLGDDLVQLTELAEASAKILKTIDGATNIETSTNNNNTEFVLTLDQAKAAAVGLTPQTISSILRTSVFGSDATSLTTLQDDIDVVVKLNLTNDNTIRYDQTNQITIEELLRVNLPTPSGATVPLDSLVEVSLRESSSVINHEDGKRVISLSADITGAGNVAEINAELRDRIESEIGLPDGVELKIGGEADESNQAFIEMFIALIVGIVLMIAVLVLQFNSYLHTKYVLSILPYSLIGILFGLALTQNALSFPSIMGFIALSGIVVNNSILLIDMMNSERRAHPNKSIKEVVLDSAANRLRPILLTTTTTVVGMIPLTYTDDLWAPLAYAVMFGLLFSVFITLILVPIAYSRKPGKLE